MLTIVHLLKTFLSLSPFAQPSLDYFGEYIDGKFTITQWNTRILGEQPSQEVLDIAVANAEEYIRLNSYKELRKREYPPMADYLDGVVKGDQAQIQAYIDACLAVKAKYPKP